MDALILLAAAAEHAEEHTPTVFYVAGIILAVFAVAVGVVGILRPAMEGVFNTAAMGLGAVLSAAAMVAIVVS